MGLKVTLAGKAKASLHRQQHRGLSSGGAVQHRQKIGLFYSAAVRRIMGNCSNKHVVISISSLIRCREGDKLELLLG